LYLNSTFSSVAHQYFCEYKQQQAIAVLPHKTRELTVDELCMNKDCKLELGNECYVEKINDNLIVIRKYEDGKPSIKAVEFPPYRWKELEYSLDKIEEAISEVRQGKDVAHKAHSGGNVYVSVSKQYLVINVRHFWKPKDSKIVQATRKGVTLKFDQFEKLKSAVEIMPDFIPELKHCLPCWMGSDHQN